MEESRPLRNNSSSAITGEKPVSDEYIALAAGIGFADINSVNSSRVMDSGSDLF